MKKIIDHSKLYNFFSYHIKKYNHKKYWRMRDEVVNPNSTLPIWLRLYYLYKIKRSDAFNNATMGTGLGQGAYFKSPPYLPHGLNGIVIAWNAKIGSNCTICQQVTIADTGGYGEGITIGDNCFIGAGAKIIKNVTIGDNVKIGANAVVVKDVPSNCTVIGIPAYIVKYGK